MIVEGSDLTVNVTITENGSALNISGATVTLLYNPPSGIEGEWTPTVISAPAGTVKYVITKEDNTLIGEYRVWAKVVKADLSVLITGASVFYVNRAGTVGA